MIKNYKLDIFLKLGAFYLLSWSIHIVLISIFSFFHFRLNHRLMVIENWIYDFSWVAFFLSKSLALFLYLKFFSTERTEGRFQNSVKTSFSQLGNSFYIIPVLCICFLCFFINPVTKVNSNFEISRSIFHIISISLTFGIDLLFLKNVRYESKERRWLEALGCSFLSFLFFKLSMPYSNTELFFFNLNLIVFTFFYFSKELSFPMSFVILVIVPLYSIFGFDPIWGNDYSFFDSSLNNLNIHTTALVIALFTFYIFENRKRSTV